MLCVLSLCTCLAVSLPAQERTAGGSARQASPAGWPAPLLKIYEDFAKTREAAAGTTDSARVRPARRVQRADTAPDPAYPFLLVAYDAKREGDYDTAVKQFLGASEASPLRTDIRKDLAYTYYLVGRDDLAREQFAAVHKLQPDDEFAAMELAYLDYESARSQDKADAWKIFSDLTRSADPEIRQSAAAAFAFVDGTLADRLAQKEEVLIKQPDNVYVSSELGTALFERNKFQESIGFLQQAIDSGYTYLYPLRSDALVRLGRTSDAVVSLNACLTIDNPYAVEECREYLATIKP